MKCKIKRGDREGLVEIKGEIRRYRTFRIKVIYRWMGYLREVDYTEIEQVQQENRVGKQVQSVVLIRLLVEVDRVGRVRVEDIQKAAT